MESFDWAIWSFVWKDSIAGIRNKWRVIKEAAVSLSVGYIIFPLFGSADSTKDFAVEKLLVIPATLVVMMLIHALWSWVTGPRRLFYQQSERLAELTQSEAIAKAAVRNERLANVRGYLGAHINNVHGVEDQDEMAAWVAGAEDMVRGMIPSMIPRLRLGWPQPHRDSPDLSAQDRLALEKTVSSLKVITTSIQLADLP